MCITIFTFILLTSTTLAARLPLGPGHFPIIPSKFDPNFAYPGAKRDDLVSDAAHGRHTFAQEDLSAVDTLSESSVSPPPVTSGLVSATTLVTVTATAPVSVVPTSTLPAVPDDNMAGVSNDYYSLFGQRLMFLH
jgi:hypothetical protein